MISVMSVDICWVDRQQTWLRTNSINQAFNKKNASKSLNPFNATTGVKNKNDFIKYYKITLDKLVCWLGTPFPSRYSKKAESYIIDTDNLHVVEQVETPLCSAMALKEFSYRKLLFSPSSVQDSALSSQGDSLPTTLSKYGESVPSTPSFNRTGTQRSYGWNFRRDYPDGSEDVTRGLGTHKE